MVYWILFKVNNMQLKNKIEQILFSSKFLLIPFFFILFFGMIVYLYIYCKELYHYITILNTINTEDGTLMIFSFLDIIMTAAVASYIIRGGYTTFVSKNHDQEGEKASSGVLKVKMATALIGVGLIHLMQWMLKSTSLQEKII